MYTSITATTLSRNIPASSAMNSMASSTPSASRYLRHASASVSRWTRCQLRPLLSLLGRKAECLYAAPCHRSSPRRGFSDYACVPAKMPGASPRLSATVRQRWLSLLPSRQILPPSCSPRRRYCLVYGAGPMGLTIIQALKGVYGVKQVIVVDRIAERLQMARENGADLTLDNTDQPLAEQLAQRQLAPTLVIDAACHPAILQEAILLASPPPASVYSVSPARPRPSLSKASPVKKFLFSPPG